jgi:inositol phosphorylceramide mannosyltransferase catalytic subunit
MELTDIFIISLTILIIIIVTSKKKEQYENIVPFPRIIHQIFFSFSPGATIPDKWIKNHEIWKDMHPDWEVILWDEESSRELITEMDSSFLETYDGFKYPIQRVDAIRPFILKKHGGIYVDLDT